VFCKKNIEIAKSLLLVGASRGRGAGSQKGRCGVKTTPAQTVARKQHANMTSM